MQYLPIEKTSLPEQFEINYGGDSYVIRFDYNTTYDHFTVSLYKVGNDGNEPVVIGEKLVLEKPLWSDFIPDITPGPRIIPLDLSGLHSRITWENFGLSVFLYVDDDIEFRNVVRGEDYVL